jgi:hypothetical protein
MRPDQNKKSDPAANRRKKPRYAISPNIRLKAVLALFGESAQASGGAWKDWPGTLVDLSATGAHVQVNLAAVAYPENPCRLKLSLGTFKLEVPGTVAHFVCSARYTICGVNFDFSYAGVEKAYLRVLEPVMVGATLAPVEAKPDDFGRNLERFSDKNSAHLAVKRDKPGGPITGFEFQIGRHMFEAERPSDGEVGVRPTLRVKLAPGEGESTSLTAAQDAEARWQYNVVASNASEAVPADVRKFLLLPA